MENSEEFFDLTQEINIEEGTKEVEGKLKDMQLEEAPIKVEEKEEEEKKEPFMKDDGLS